jgi:hypothetical protein
MTAPWLADRRYHRPDARHTAGLTYDDITPTEADNTELRRALRKQDEPWQQAWDAGLESHPNPFPDDEALTATWHGGRHERNRQRQERALAWFRKQRKSKGRKSRWNIKVRWPR